MSLLDIVTDGSNESLIRLMFCKVDELSTVVTNRRRCEAFLQNNEICAVRDDCAGKNTHTISRGYRPRVGVSGEALTDQAQGLCFVEIFAPNRIPVHG